MSMLARQLARDDRCAPDLLRTSPLGPGRRATCRAAQHPAGHCRRSILALREQQYGTTGVRTPAFDRVAQSGVLFKNAFCASPGCAPSRAAC